MLRTLPEKSLQALLALILGLSVPSGHASDSPQPSEPAGDQPRDEPIEAIWHVQYLLFEFNGQRTLYACDSFEKKIRNILLAAGAHPSVTVDARCAGSEPLAHAGPLSASLVSQVSAKVALANPVPATQENILAATTFDFQDELLARVKKMKLPDPSSLERFPAVWQTVSLSRARRVRLDVADCDLLMHIQDQLFQKMGVTPAGDKLTCNTAAKLTRPEYAVRALVPAPEDATAEMDKRKP